MFVSTQPGIASNVFEIKKWKRGDLFCGRGGGSVLWRVDKVYPLGTIEATSLLDGSRRCWYPEHMVQRSGMKYCPCPIK